jgi:O-antigen/teichoic acid export membrane protein
MRASRAQGRAADHLVRGSAFLLAATFVASAIGFVFWLVAARLYSAGAIGIASTLISATTLIAYLSLFGFNSTLIRFLPLSARRDVEVTQAITVTAAGALVLATVYTLVAPLVSPRLDLLSDMVHSTLFVALTAAAAVNLLTDSVFIALRGAKYNLLVDGVVQSFLKLAFVVVLVTFGAFGIYAAYGAAALVAVALSVALLHRVMGLRPRMGRLSTLRPYLGYTGGNYVSSCLNLLPMLVLPFIVLNAHGPEAAGYYFIAFQIAMLLNGVSFAICESAFAEGAHDAGGLRRVARRSAKLVFTAQVAGALVTAIAAPYVLRIFGSAYSDEGSDLLVVLALASVAVAFNTWTSMLLKLTGNGVSWLVWSHVVYALAIIAGAQAVSGGQLVWIGVAWGAGNALCGLIALAGLLGSRRHEAHIWGNAGA